MALCVSPRAGFFPRQVLVKKINLVARRAELLTTHSADVRADDRYLSMLCPSGRGTRLDVLL